MKKKIKAVKYLKEEKIVITANFIPQEESVSIEKSDIYKSRQQEGHISYYSYVIPSLDLSTFRDFALLGIPKSKKIVVKKDMKVFKDFSKFANKIKSFCKDNDIEFEYVTEQSQWGIFGNAVSFLNIHKYKILCGIIISIAIYIFKDEIIKACKNIRKYLSNLIKRIKNENK